MEKLKVGFIGAGNMAEAMMAGLIGAKLSKPADILASDVNLDRLKDLKQRRKIAITTENIEVFCKSHVVFLAVKPQIMEPVLTGLAKCPELKVEEKKLVISFAAGVPIANMEKWLYANMSAGERKRVALFRTMPNTPALVGKGMIGMAVNRHVTAQDIETAKALLSATGLVMLFDDEDDLNTVTAVSGTGPAYVFYLAEAMMIAAVKMGIPNERARKLVVQTLIGASHLLDESGETPEVLRKKVTSPGGTTEAALGMFMQRKVQDSLVSGIITARDRSRELSGE